MARSARNAGMRSARVLDVVEPGTSKLERYGAKYKQACADATDAEKRKEKYKTLLLVEVKAHGEEEENDKGEPRWRAESDAHKFVTVKGSNATIKPELLAAQNVPAKVIRKATVTTEYEYVRVDRKTN